MSAIARYFHAIGKTVAGYDRTATQLTEELIEDGINIHFLDNKALIPEAFFAERENTLVVYTPAVPETHTELRYFQENEYALMKRSQVLGLITTELDALAVAGTHGKTTTSTMVAHIFNESIGCNAFLGGISSNFKNNLLINKKSRFVTVEADEFDRSFLTLYPKSAIVTAIDADHLDIYGTKLEIENAFKQFVSQIKPDGELILKYGVELDKPKGLKVYTYGVETKEADFYAQDLKLEKGYYTFCLHTPKGSIKGIKLGIPGRVNVENAVSAAAMALLNGVSAEALKNALCSFKGVKRRFDVKLMTEDVVYIDDYAHHPEEIRAFVSSVRAMFPKRKITGVFQPHLFSRTKDFAGQFADSLGLLDELILLDIYPAREEPIPGITSEIIYNVVSLEEKSMVKLDDLCGFMHNKEFDVLVTMGAGNIDRMVEPIYNIVMGLHQIKTPKH